MSFSWREFGEDGHDEDGVFISDDLGSTWYQVYPFGGQAASFENEVIDLDEAAGAAGLALTEEFLVKFQYNGDWQIPVEGVVVDEVAVYIAAPEPPAGLDASDGIHADRVHITWSGVSGATDYEVYRAESAAGAKSMLGRSGGATTYDDVSAAACISSTYWVKACHGAVCSDFSEFDTGWRGGSPPETATGVGATDGAHADKVVVTWNESPGATEYEIWRAESSGGTKTRLGTSAGATAYDDSTALPGLTHYYWVKACSACGCSGFGAADSGRLSETAPATPPDVQATGSGRADHVLVTWGAVPTADYYEVHRAESVDGTKNLVETTIETSFADPSAAPGVTYYYWVGACNGAGCSQMSGYATGGWVLRLFLPVVQRSAAGLP